MRKRISAILIFLSSVMVAQASNSFMVFSDTHYYSPDENFKESVLYELTLAAIEEEVEFVFITGDLVLRNSGNGSDYDSLLADWRFVLDTLNLNGIRLFACRGNNDIYSPEAWASLFKDNYALPDNGPEGEKYYTYSFTYDNFMFMSLDQYTNYNRVNQSWVEEQLNSNDKPFVFAASHEPAFEVYHWGLSSYPDERDSFWTSFTEKKGKIYFCGHDHFYDHSILLDDDDFPGNDAHQIIVGTGGGYFHSDSTYGSYNGRWEPQTILHEKSYGYLLVKVSGTGFQTIWKHRTGQFEFEEGGDNYFYGITSTESDRFLPENFKLYQNFPNPFNPTTTIKYSLPSVGTGHAPSLQMVSLVVYDVLGREVSTLVETEQRPGNYEVKWDGLSASGGHQAASGIYLYKLITDIYSETKKMVLLR